VGETLEEVQRYNPSHTAPIKDSNEIKHMLEIYKDVTLISNFVLEEKTRMCKEVWGVINI
jgi:hypothetical protein